MSCEVKYAIVSREQGAWRWQKRYALRSYVEYITKDGRLIYRFFESLNEKIKPKQIKEYMQKYNCGVGSLHNRPVFS